MVGKRKYRINFTKNNNSMFNNNINTFHEIGEIVFKGKKSKNLTFHKYTKDKSILVGEMKNIMNLDTLNFQVGINFEQGFEVRGLEGNDFVSIICYEYFDDDESDEL